MTLIEKMARAMLDDMNRGMPRFVAQTWEQCTDLARESMLFRARKALEAMRGDPGHDITAAVVPPGKDRSDVLRIWNALIDAALKEEG